MKKKRYLFSFLFALVGVIIFILTAGNKPSKSNVDDFIYCYTLSVGDLAVSVEELDVHGDDYRREYRYDSYDNAIGKKLVFDNYSMEVLTYGYRFMEKVRVYATSDSFEELERVYKCAALILDDTLTYSQIDNAIIDLQHTWTFALGNKTSISGYIKEVTHDGSFVCYELLIDCDDILYG